MSRPASVMAFGRLPLRIEKAIARVASVETADEQTQTQGDYLCAVIPAADAGSLIPHWRGDPQHHSAPVIAVASQLEESVFLDAMVHGADDVVFSGDQDGMARRIEALSKIERGKGSLDGSVLVIHPDPAHRRRLGRPLFRSGLSVDFAASLAEVRVSDVRPDVVVVHSAEAEENVDNQVRELLDAPDLPVVVIRETSLNVSDGGRRVERTASIPLHVPADHLLFVVNELLNPDLQEQRSSPRRLHATLCAFRSAGRLLPSYGITFNLSRGGLFVRTLDLPQMGDSVWLEFRPPGSEAVVHLRATVAWRTVGGATPPGFAVQLQAHRCPTGDLATYRELYQRLLDSSRSIRGEDEPERSAEPTAARLLIVDDDPKVRKSLARAFRGTPDLEVSLAEDGREAVELFRRDRHDVVLTDVTMPNLSGIDLLKAIRADDESVPVIFTTGNPALETAIAAMEHGAFRYILKPFDVKALRDTVSSALGMARLARFRREAAMEVPSEPKHSDEEAELNGTLTRAIDQLYPHYQPILRWPAKEVIAYEALARTREPAVPHPGVLFDTAERLDRTQEVGRRMRELAAEPFEQGEALLFLNLHPSDLLDEQLYDTKSTLAKLGRRVVLEITERASLNGISDLRSRVTRLRELGFQVAVDDLGAGYAGLSAFVALQPDVVKLDMSLVRDVHESATKQRLVRSMVSVCEELNIQVIAEGVENREELDTLAELGCELFQGFFFARPGDAFPEVDWPS
jgi:EAL domain-containing protein (putative c-di-GMP-specific phosphodiesterase class I)/ActR/RegA family two-component response regulator/Tfp pilus assembly protein PilZ